MGYDELMWQRATYERVGILSVIACFLLLTFVEPLYALFHRPENTVYTYVHNHPEDYFYFLHIMRQGYDGAWLATTRMTPEVNQPQFVTPFFLVLGKIGRIVPLGMGELYTLARVCGAAALMLAIWKLIRIIFIDPRQRIGALLITLTGAFLPVIKDGVLEMPVLVGTTWTELDPLVRLSFVPHHLTSKVLFVILLLLFLQKPIKRWLIVVLTVLMGFISPVILVTYAGTLGIWLIFEKFPRRMIVPISLAAAATGAVSFYHWYVSHSVFPWTTYGPPWETNWLYLVSPFEYFQSFGGLLPVAVMGIAVGFRVNRGIRLLAAWVITGWLLIFVFRPYLPFSVSRYLAGYQWISVGILASYGLVWLGKKIRTGFIVFAAFCILSSLPSWYLSLNQRISYIQQQVNNPNVFVSDDLSQTLGFLNRLGGGCIVAAPDWFSTMIPAYSSCRSVSGHRLMTYVNDIKVYEMNEFFFQPVPIEKKSARIKQYGITHVITLDGITGIDILPLLAPTPAFIVGGVRVWEVR